MNAAAGIVLSPEIVFIAAVADNGVIGRDNKMPWHLRSDLQRLKKMTLNKPVVMGRKTFLSIGKPLPGRTNIVLTRDATFAAAGVVVARSMDAAREVAMGDALRRFATEIFVIGGAEIFAQWIDLAGRMEITRVHANPDGDTFFAPIDPVKWEQIASSRHPKTANDTADFSYVTYTRQAAH